MPPSPKSLTYIKGMKWWPWKGTLHLCLLSRRTAELTCGLMWLFNMVSANCSITSELMFNPLTSTIDIISCSTNSKPSAEILASLASQQRGPNCLKGCSYNRPYIISERDFFFVMGTFLHNLIVWVSSHFYFCKSGVKVMQGEDQSPKLHEIEFSETNIQVYFEATSPKVFRCKNLNYLAFGRTKNIFKIGGGRGEDGIWEASEVAIFLLCNFLSSFCNVLLFHLYFLQRVCGNHINRQDQVFDMVIPNSVFNITKTT